MRRYMAILAALALLTAFAACGKPAGQPTTGTDATAAGETASAADETTAATQETTTEAAAESAPAEETSAGEASSYKPTEAVTYSDAGIPISNAYFSLRLPASWDGHYRCETKYDGDVMRVRVMERASAEAGWGGHLFTVALVPDGEEVVWPAYDTLHGMTDGTERYTLYAVYPTDVQFTEENAAQYNAMKEQIEAILKTLEPGDGYWFWTDVEG